jgi:hypothetical protein
MLRWFRPLLCLIALVLVHAPFVHAHAGEPAGRGWHLHLPRIDSAPGPVLVAHESASTELPTAWVPQRELRQALRAWSAPVPGPMARAAATQRVARVERVAQSLPRRLRTHREGWPPPALAPPHSV